MSSHGLKINRSHLQTMQPILAQIQGSSQFVSSIAQFLVTQFVAQFVAGSLLPVFPPFPVRSLTFPTPCHNAFFLLSFTQFLHHSSVLLYLQLLEQSSHSIRYHLLTQQIRFMSYILLDEFYTFVYSTLMLQFLL